MFYSCDLRGTDMPQKSTFLNSHVYIAMSMEFLDYLTMSSQGQIGENITVGTLIGKVGVWIRMVSNLLITSITILTLSR